MAVSDTRITDWSETTASNSPAGGQKIVRDLAAQFRNIKSIARGESLRKDVEEPEDIEFEETSLTTFTFTGDVLDHIQKGQKIFGLNSAGLVIKTGVVLSAALDGGDTEIEVDWLNDAGGTITSFQLGARRDPPSIPNLYLVGEKIASSTSTTQSVSFTDSAGTALTLPGVQYMVLIQPKQYSASTKEMSVRAITKSTTGFTFTVGAAPVVGNSIWRWAVILQPWW